MHHPLRNTLVAFLLFPLSVMAEQDDVAKARAWVEAHAPDCTLTDGYVCSDTTEDDFVGRRGNRLSVPGNYLLAWATAKADFDQIDDLAPARKALKHYRIGFTENATDVIILFNALLLPRINAAGQPEGILTAAYGRSTKYWIDKKTLKIRKRLFLK